LALYKIVVLSNRFGKFLKNDGFADEPSVNRRNPAPDRLPASRVARGGKGYLPVNQ